MKWRGASSQDGFYSAFDYIEHFGFLDDWDSIVMDGRYQISFKSAFNAEGEFFNIFNDIPSSSVITKAIYYDFIAGESYTWNISNSNRDTCYGVYKTDCEFTVKIEFLEDFSSVQLGDFYPGNYTFPTNLNSTVNVTIYDSNGDVPISSPSGALLAKFKFDMFTALVIPAIFSLGGGEISLERIATTFQFPTFIAGYTDSFLNLTTTESRSLENGLINLNITIANFITPSVTIEGETGLMINFEVSGYEIELTSRSPLRYTPPPSTPSSTTGSKTSNFVYSFDILLLVISLTILSSIFAIVRKRKYN